MLLLTTTLQPWKTESPSVQMSIARKESRKETRSAQAKAKKSDKRCLCKEDIIQVKAFTQCFGRETGLATARD